MNLLTASQELEIKKFNKNVEWFKNYLRESKGDVLPVKTWGNIGDANKILGHNYSSQFYKRKRLGEQVKGKWIDPVFINGRHWRKIGSRIEYNLRELQEWKDQQ